MRGITCKNAEGGLQSQKYCDATNADSRMLDDINRFCVHGSSILLVDTTFELCDGMWLTDSAFQYEALLNEKGGNPMFPGPYMWLFRKAKNLTGTSPY